MSKLNQKSQRASRAHWAWLVPILALSPMALAAKGCDNAGTVGDDCPKTADCTGGTGGSSASVPVGKACGGLLGITCNDGLFCNFPVDAMCGAGNQQGVCAAKPEACTEIYAPVCGCDGKTYGNECSALGVGVSVAATGECAGGSGGSTSTGGSAGTGGSTSTGGSTGTGGSSGSGKTCGGLQGLKCAASEYCDFPTDAACGAADQTGKCATKPQVCDDLYAPVCGCDGKTYSNDCSAASAGVSIAATGECKASGTACGARAGDTCASGEYCLYTPDAMCGRADATGTCTKIPKGQACDAVYDPVCGCDGMTYGNDCEASIAGASIDHTGACK